MTDATNDPNGHRHTIENGLALQMLEFINASDTQFHAVSECKALLSKAGYSEIHEKEAWDIVPGGRYYFSRADSSLVAFAVGKSYQPGGPFHIIGAHTDSPCFKLKPNSRGCKSGYGMLNVEPYGGLLHHTWFDRDLSVAGKVLVKREDGKIESRLVKIPEAILRIPMLAIHLNRDIGTEGFKPNKQTECVPLFMNSADGKGTGDHHSRFLDILGATLSVNPCEIVDFDLNVIDTQLGVLGGGNLEYVFVGRLDNLCSSWCGLQALIDCTHEIPDGETAIKCLALFDNEEVGSDSTNGAGGSLLMDTVSRVATLLGGGEEGVVQRCLQQSFLVSADMAHGLHPNYSDKHEPDHAPRLGGGIVIKHNANQRYATEATSAALFRMVCQRAEVPVAEFVVRSDMACGSTIGPILASGMGIMTVDVGVPQLSMHSIREMCHVADVETAFKAFRVFYRDFSIIYGTFTL